MNDKRLNNQILPVEVVFAPGWWFHREGITFEEDFFYDPARRVEVERKMEKALFERWGRYGLGNERDKNLPAVGAVHLAAGFLVSEMLGCKVEYKQDSPPQVICANIADMNIEVDSAFQGKAYKRFKQLTEALKQRYGYLTGDVNWSGILNLALDLRGENLFIDMYDKPDEVRVFFSRIAAVIEKLTADLEKETGSTSISVNRNVRNLRQAVYLHSECSHTMISTDDYEKFLFEYDLCWCRYRKPFGIHFCGKDPHRYADVFRKLPHLDFLDVGWGGDIKKLREALPETFLNIRLSPVEIIEQSSEEISGIIRRLAAQSGQPYLTGVCCINIDQNAADEKITAIFQTVEELRKEYAASC